MKKIKCNSFKGTSILLGNEKRILIDSMVKVLRAHGFQEISIPIIQFQETFRGKVGEENQKMIFNLSDKKERRLCLAPEYTAIIQRLAATEFKQKKDVKLFYIQECFRGESPQRGRYRQFTQIGVEIINPTIDYTDVLSKLALKLLLPVDAKFRISYDVTRGLDYYTEGKGFEIRADDLGSSDQVVGGGAYEGGIGFAIGIDRLLLLTQDTDEESKH